ncbi:hypothetical protein KKC13_02225 [bacterium]|nr:hypothetical protein [bacterium]MBU1959098.1 hypothetical protein [bacterium]
MLEIASQIILCLILATLIGGIIGYLLGKATCGDDQCHEAPKATHELHIDNQNKVKATALMTTDDTTDETNFIVGTQPLLLTEARKAGKDNLQLIKGVGNVLEQLLNETGIYHFDQIANLSEEEATWLDNSLSFPGRIKRENWIGQAKELAEGKSTEFSERVEKGEVATSKKS